MIKRVIILTFTSVLYIIGYSQTDSIIIKQIETDFYRYTLRNDTTYLDSIYSDRTTSWGIIAGVGINDKVTIELGYGRAVYGSIWHHWHFSNIYFGSEFIYRNEKSLIAPKISFWGNGGSTPTAIGLNFLYYTDLNHYSNIVFRPEVGLGYYKFKLVWGYNISLNKRAFDTIKRNNVSFIWYFDTNSKKTSEVSYREVLNFRKERELKKQKLKNKE